MKKLFLACFAVCAAFVVSAQKAYFVYLQTDDGSPFYVRMADKVFSSSTAGYLILPNLADSTYLMGVGFPRSSQPETRFAVTVNQNDKGYLLKNFSDGLALFDIQDLSVLKAISAAKDNTVYETKTDKFSATLSKAADDPSLLRVPVAKKEEPKAEPEKKEIVTAKTDEPPAKPEQKEPAVVKNEGTQRKEIKVEDSSAASQDQTINTKVAKKDEPQPNSNPATELAAKVDETKPAPKVEETNTTNSVKEYKPSVVVRRSESSTTEGFGVVYFDKADDKTDTVRILIPSSKVKFDQDVPAATNAETEKKPEATIAEPLKTEGSKTHVDSISGEPKTAETKNVKAITSSSCKELASDKDFMKLRKNMAAKSSDDDMIFEAKKAFRIRCFTSEQVRYLSTLFLTSAAKYQFFDTAYNFVSDRQNFAALQSEIKDEYFLKRFKALVGE